MQRQILAAVLMSIVLVSPAFGKDWYEKSCKITQNQKGTRNVYVGGPVNKSHLHIGPDFLSINSVNNSSKPITSGKANCTLIGEAISKVGDGGFTSPNDVTECLNAARSHYCK